MSLRSSILKLVRVGFEILFFAINISKRHKKIESLSKVSPPDKR